MQEQFLYDILTPAYSLATVICQYKELYFLNQGNWREI